jgi:hypothetical protein
VLVVCVSGMCLLVADARAAVIGPTPRAAALLAARHYAEKQVRAWNRPGVTYSLGACQVLHRRPWLAWGCEMELHGTPPPECPYRLILAVRHLPDGAYSATAVKLANVGKGC